MIASTFVDSALPGSHDFAWLSWTSVSLPASGARNTSAPSQITSITHLPRLPDGSLAALPAARSTAFILVPFGNPLVGSANIRGA